MKEERRNRTLVHTGTVEEIVSLLREHAERADDNADYFGAADMRRGADELEAGLRMAYKYRAAYVIADERDAEASAAELVDAGGTP